ncbi:MAG: GtrA family protein [Marmoricola sp.]|nr:GtrA family protein [Marmoricola sp.]
MGRRLRRITGEVARFSAVNIVATAIALVLFNALVHGITGWFAPPMNGNPITGYLLANSVGMFVSYYGARFYAFKHRQVEGVGNGLINYVVINLASFVIPITCLFVSRNVFGWDTIYADNLSGNVIGAILGNVFRFWAFRRFVFTGRSPLILEHVAGSDASKGEHP